VFGSRDGEEAMRRMIDATVTFWDRAWPFLEFVLRSRRIDPVVAREMAFIDRLRHAHYWTITKRLEDEGRLRVGQTSDEAANLAFALTVPTIYEELVRLRGASLTSAINATTRAIFAAMLEPDAEAARIGPPDWAALEAAGAARARAAGSDPARLSADWQSTAPAPWAPGGAAQGGSAVPGSDER
jgi:hypothetical protein